jgi:hypothetical protein
MLSYKDRTFCQFHKECKDGKKCSIALTDELIKEAREFGLPIALYTDKLGCFKAKDKK